MIKNIADFTPFNIYTKVKIKEVTGNIKLLTKLRKISMMTLK
jgi:hypothetical protein